MRLLCVISLICLIVSCSDSNEKSKFQTKTPDHRHQKTSEVRGLNLRAEIVGETFRIGSGLGGRSFTLKENGTFDQFGFCDVCPGSYSFGTYSLRNDTLFKQDTLCYSTHPHFATPEDTIPCDNLKTDTLYLWSLNSQIFFSDIIQHSMPYKKDKSHIFWRKD